jgi:hypothetical protein
MDLMEERTISTSVLFSFSHMLRVSIHQLNNDKVDMLREHGHKLMGDWKDEAIQSLRAEGVMQESCRVFEIQGNWFAVGVMSAQGKILDGPDSDVNREHKRVLSEVVSSKISTEIIYDLQIPDETDGEGKV